MKKIWLSKLNLISNQLPIFNKKVFRMYFLKMHFTTIYGLKLEFCKLEYLNDHIIA